MKIMESMFIPSRCTSEQGRQISVYFMILVEVSVPNSVGI